MAKKHRGTELNNVKETWEQNERENADATDRSTAGDSELEETISREAAEYDNSDKDSRLLGGERASVSDDNTDDEK